MRKLYREYFYIPKGGKIREKVMLARVATTVVIVLLCLAAMGFTAYAYFSASLTSGSNKITAATFDIEVTVDDNVLSARKGNAYEAILEAGVHIVTLQQTVESTAQSGFVVITADGHREKYYSTQLKKDGPITFTFTVDTKTTVYFLPSLGTSASYANRENGDGAETDPYFIENRGEIGFTSGVNLGPAEEEPPVSPVEDEKEPSAEPTKPTGSAENSDPEQSKPENLPVTEPSEPAESAPPEPTENPEPEESEPTESTETEPSGGEISDETEPETDPSEAEDEPVDEPAAEPGV